MIGLFPAWFLLLIESGIESLIFFKAYWTKVGSSGLVQFNIICAT